MNEIHYYQRGSKIAGTLRTENGILFATGDTLGQVMIKLMLLWRESRVTPAKTVVPHFESHYFAECA